jgi:hypothetical protein
MYQSITLYEESSQYLEEEEECKYCDFHGIILPISIIHGRL